MNEATIAKKLLQLAKLVEEELYPTLVAEQLRMMAEEIADRDFAHEADMEELRKEQLRDDFDETDWDY